MSTTNTFKVYNPTPKIQTAAKLLNAKLQLSYRSLAYAHSAVLYTDDVMNNSIFGENAILKYMAMTASSQRVSTAMDIALDEWLEVERGIRTANDGKVLSGLLSDLDGRLAGNTGFLVSGHATVADVTLVHTLKKLESDALKPCENVSQYLSHVSKHPAFATSGTASTQLGLVEMDIYSTILSMFSDDVDDSFFENEGNSGNMIQKTKDVKQGHYQCTSALKLFQILKKAGNTNDAIKTGPKGLAQAIIDNLPSDKTVDKSNCKVAGPGFIMINVRAEYLVNEIKNFITKDGARPQNDGGNGTVLVDFSSPNIAKEMHVGHLRSTIIGESVCRILEFTNHKTHRINHVGDWGTQFGMLIEYLKRNNATGDVNESSVGDLTEFYKAAKQCFDEDEDFKKRSQLNVVKLQSGDDECTKIWQTLCDVSRASFEKVYKRLDVSLTECGESFYNPLIPGVIDKFKAGKFVTDDPSGAKLCFVDGFDAPLMLQKSDGGFGYDSTDMAALDYRINSLKCDRVIYITDFTQSQHFQMCFKAAQKIGWANDSVELMHIGFGTVMGEDNKRFKTRSGETVKLVDLLDESSRRMEASLRERMTENKANITEDEVKHVADILGYSAVKYFDLHRNPTSNYVFSYDRMLDTKGNTAIYLLYAHARLESILTKAAEQFPERVASLDNMEDFKLEHDAEINLAYHINLFDEVIEAVLIDLLPYRICDYLYAVATSASDFVTKCKVLGSDEMEARLLLCKSTGMVMRTCFELLGLQYVMSI